MNTNTNTLRCLQTLNVANFGCSSSHPFFVFSAECTIGMVTALKHYGTMALWAPIDTSLVLKGPPCLNKDDFDFDFNVCLINQFQLIN